jgi:dihydrofolate reductase
MRKLCIKYKTIKHKMEAILSTDINFGISKNGIIPWKSKKDMCFFFNKTKNNVVIMGKNTYFSLPQEFRPLKDRLNVVLTNNSRFYANNNEFINYPNLIFTDDETITFYIQQNKKTFLEIYPFLSNNFKIIIIGGKQIYEKYVPLCSTVWVTTIKKNYSCDLFYEYEYKHQFKDELVEEDDELKIVAWKKIL